MDDGDEGRAPGPEPTWWSRPDHPAGPAERPAPARPGAPQDRPADAPARPADAEPTVAEPTVAEPAVADGRQPDGEPTVTAASQPAPGEPGTGAPAVPGAAESAPAARPSGPPPAVRPLHDPEPYGTPPYGRPGPWAPAPPVQPLRYDPWATAPTGPTAPTAPGAAFGALPGGRPPAPAPRRGWLVAGVLTVALVAGGLGGGVGTYLERHRGDDRTTVRLPQAVAGERQRDPGSIAGIADRALPGVVTIHVSGGGEEGTGTGFVLNGSGHILTNNHVVEAAATSGTISVTFNGGDVAEARIVGRDSGYDLAVIKVDGVSGLRPLTLGNSDSVRVGDPVVAIGAPYDLAGTVTSGIISAKERPITAGGEEDGSDVSYVDALQTDAPINPGNSGGPLMDSAARVIGINSAIRAADSGSGLGGGQGGSIGLGFAIPINQGRRVAEELINTGRAAHPVIGVYLDRDYSGDGARVRDDDSGDAVNPGGPADRAGIEAGDVITQVDGVKVHSDQELIVRIRSHRPGDRLRLTLLRDGRERTIELTLGSAGGKE
ncbi:trypsin-like peptidase domain-containing protein [Streptomyces sp. B1866]|uniref:trypsin-like peptidase domain-containing protein n=1 Tax=Streptomyces sp. B1866 TaxID=3075431 RepID=UPI00288E10D3|nr:trypsin-like peptidase domain-containing protein [Streptomyces sp. B1866]MDT3396229.1 trypsin-like peptidase domain-containing protein [Streptomyces sp. B1866]